MKLREHNRANPPIQVPPWPILDDPTADINSPYHVAQGNAGAVDYSPYYLQEALTALQRYLPSSDAVSVADDGDSESESDSHTNAPVDAFSFDQFRMFEFKVRRCARGRSHDWTDCPYAHPGEKACRRDPRKFHCSGTACHDFRKGYCQKDYACEYAHGDFERWLHPARYRTQLYEDGSSCQRRVCFFAHTAEQLLLAPPHRRQFSMLEEMASLKKKEQLERAKSMGNNRRSVALRYTGFGSPRGPLTRPGFGFYSRKSRCRLR